MKKKKSQLIPQKYKKEKRKKKRSENTMKIICQQIQQPRRNGQDFRNTEPTKIESRRNR